MPRQVLRELTLISEQQPLYRMPAGKVVAMFDGDLRLEETCFQLDHIDRRILLSRASAFVVIALIEEPDAS